MGLTICAGVLAAPDAEEIAYYQHHERLMRQVSAALAARQLPSFEEPALPEETLHCVSLGSYSNAYRRLEQLKQLAIWVWYHARLPQRAAQLGQPDWYVHDELEAPPGSWLSWPQPPGSLGMPERFVQLWTLGDGAIFLPIALQPTTLQLGDEQVRVASLIGLEQELNFLMKLLSLDESTMWHLQEWLETPSPAAPCAGMAWDMALYQSEFCDAWDACNRSLSVASWALERGCSVHLG